jgi:aspartyl aminopeptidase
MLDGAVGCGTLTTVERAAAEALKSFIDAAPSPWHAGALVAARLRADGFLRLEEEEAWSLQPNTGYFVLRDQSSIIAFHTGDGDPVAHGYRIVGAHTDSPGFRIKPRPLDAKPAGTRLGVEIYGGPIVATFADRDLGLAGRLYVAGRDGNLSARLLHVGQPLLRLPTPAIHLNRGVNSEGLRFDLQNEVPLVLVTLADGLPDQQAFVHLLADWADVDAGAIRGWELAIVDTQPAALFGPDEAGLAASRIDNLASCHAALEGLVQSLAAGGNDSFAGVRACAFFDHEEVGSQSFKGAESPFLADTLSRICSGFGGDDASYRRALARSFVVSADMAHAEHPSYARFHDQTHPVRLNGGPVIKINANLRYASDAGGEALFETLCREVDVPVQRYVHRNDLPCGTTIGPITAARLGMRCVDVGNAMWSMHSLRESTGSRDQARMIGVLRHFYHRRVLPLAGARRG